jgi:hypothetical protein
MADLPTDETGLVMPRELEIFQTEPVDMAIQEMEEVPYRPVATYTPSTGDLKFEVKGSAEDYFKPSLTYLTFGLEIQKITAAGGAALADADLVAPVNNFAHSVFETLQISFGNQVVCSETSYPYRAYNTALLSYNEDARKSHLALSVYDPDTAEKWDLQVEPLEADVAKSNAGMNRRSRRFRDSNIVWCRIHLDCDVFNIDKFIPSQVDMTVLLTRSKPEFCLMGWKVNNEEPKYKINIHDPVLWVTKAKIFPTIALRHGDKFAQGKRADYNIVRVMTRPITLSAHIRSAVLDNVTTGQLPRRIFYGFVKNKAFSGDYGENPFQFENVKLTKTALYVDGKSHPTVPFEPVYTGESPNYAREYWSLFTATGIRHGNSGLQISMKDYPEGYCLYGYDISQNKAGYKSTPLNLKTRGTTRIEFQCSEALPEAYVCMVWAEYDNVLSIDGDRNVYLNHT